VKNDRKALTNNSEPQEIERILQVNLGFLNKASIKLNNGASELEPNYEKIALGLNNSYIKPKNTDDDKTWYSCKEEISKDWLGLNNGEKSITTIV
ncbi:23094_t:CDS:1, partial [Dentiscutata erythropus]